MSRGTKRKSNASSVDSQLPTTQEDTIMGENLNPKIVEGWISNTLEDAKYLDLPGKVMCDMSLGVLSNPSYKEPLARHKIDRVT